MLAWFHRASLIGKCAGAVAAITAAIIGVAAAWPLVESAFPAHRGFVRDTVHPLELAMDKQSIATDRQSIIILKGQLNEAQRDPGARTRSEERRVGKEW